MLLQTSCDNAPRCAPGTKEWRSRRVWLLSLLAMAMHALGGFVLLQFALAFSVQYKVQWLNRLPEKVYSSAEAAVDMECLQTYTEALATQYTHYSTNAFAIGTGIICSKTS